MKCPICGGELTPFDEKFVICDTCGAKIPADRVAPAVTEEPEPAPAEKPVEKTAEQKRLEELERRLNEMEKKQDEKKTVVPIGERIKTFFTSIPAFCRTHKKIVAFSALGLLVVIAVIILCVSLCGLRGVYVNENDPYEYYTFGVSNYTCTSTLFGEKYVEEGKYSLSGNTITITVEDELFGTISDSAPFKKLDGYSKVMIGEDTYFRAGRSLNSKVELTFDANGGEGSDKIKVQIGTRVEDLPQVTKVGYTAIGWKDADGKPFRKTDPIWQEKTYYAQWIECSHTEMLCTEEKCPICQKEKASMTEEEQPSIRHTNVDEHCVCVDCGAVVHAFNNNGECTHCGALQVKMEGTVVVGLEEGIKGDIIIPNYATSIGKKAFYENKTITSVTIPDSVTSIGSQAFYGCRGLAEINYMGDIAGWCEISGLDNLTSSSRTLFICGKKIEGDLVIPNGVTSIGNSAFYGCSGLTSVTIPNSVTSIGSSAFRGCTSLESISLPFLNTHLGYIFGSSSSLSNNDFVPSSLKTVVITGGSSIGYEAFYGCTGLTSVTIGNSVTSIGQGAFCVCTGLTSVTIGNSVTSIGPSAFSGCTGLTSVTIGNSVTSIGQGAFSRCSGLTSITIPSSVTSLYYDAFFGCTGLTSINVQEGNAEYHSDCNCIIHTATKALVIGCKNSVIPSDGSVTSFGYEAFHGCTGLTSITIPTSVTSIGPSAFSGCTGLTSVAIPSSVTSIDYDAFYGCIGLTSITIPTSVTSIGSYAFSGCTGLTSITIPSSVTIIRDRAFSDCSGLTSITIPSSVTSIGYEAFHGCSGLTSVTIPDSVTSIGQGAFSGCTGLTSITIPSSVTGIGSRAFSGCTGLTSITIPSSVTGIGSRAFYGCTGLTSITIPTSVTSIDDEVFYGCTGLTSITIPDGVTSIGYSTFSWCTGLTSITYQGTKAQWNAISKDSYWNSNTGNYTIRCTDGDIAKQ